MTNKEELNAFFVNCFNSILRAEEKALESITNGTLTIKEIHLIEAVFKSKAVDENCFSTIASMLGISVGTLTSSFSKLEKKGYLYKEQDPNDKRIFYIVPTRLAEIINSEHEKFHHDMIDKIIDIFPETDVDHLAKMLRTLEKFFLKFEENLA